MDGGARAKGALASYPLRCRRHGKCLRRKVAAFEPPSFEPPSISIMRNLNQATLVLLTAIALAGSAAAQAPPGDFVYLRDLDSSILQDIRYAGANNFMGRPIGGYDAAE